MRQLSRLLLASLPLLLACPAGAAEVVIYRCTDGAGALTVQNMPCPKGMQQQRKVMQAAGVVPAFRPAPEARAAPSSPNPPPPATPAAADNVTTAPNTPARPPIVSGERLPPPPLFQCSTPDQGTYLTEDPEPKSRCVPMQVNGLDGSAGTGAAQACQVVTDICARVPDQQLCAAWRQSLRESESRWRFAHADDAQRHYDDFSRLQRIVADSACGEAATQNP